MGIGELIHVGSSIRNFLNKGKESRLNIEQIIVGTLEMFLVVYWMEDRDVPYALLVDEGALSSVIGDRVRQGRLAIVLPLIGYLSGLKAGLGPAP
jgi:hypothetical protein